MKKDSKLKRARMLSGYYTATELAKDIGVSAVTLYKWEAGVTTPSKNRIIQLMEVLNKKRAEIEMEPLDLKDVFYLFIDEIFIAKSSEVTRVESDIDEPDPEELLAKVEADNKAREEQRIKIEKQLEEKRAIQEEHELWLKEEKKRRDMEKIDMEVEPYEPVDININPIQ
jgi:DNA-binding XRE family transcriptional regulator